MADEPTPRNALALLVTCVVLTAALPHVPIVHWAWWPLSLLSTLAHELGVAALLADDREPILLEVETDNRAALGLYHACGFREISTYRYYGLRP
jgi:hypothetical protein